MNAEMLRRLKIITDVTLSDLSLEELEQNLLRRVRELLAADIAMLLLCEDEGQLRLKAVDGSASEAEIEAARGVQIPVGRGIAGRIAEQGKALIFDDLSQFEIINPLLRSQKVRSLVGAPVKIQERMQGVVYIGTTEQHSFTPDDAELLQLIADRFAVATERARLHEELRDADERKAAILEAALDCIVMMDQDGVVTEFNPAAQRTFGYSREEAVGRSLGELIVPPSMREMHRQGLARFLETGVGPVLNQRIEISGMRADGSEFPVELAIVPLKIRGRFHFTGYIRDITERKQAEAEREEILAREQAARAEAEAANRAKDEFLATLSHELRTPLHPMQGWADLLLNHDLDEATKRVGLNSILHNTQIQARLVGDLLDVSRIITGKMVLDMQPVDLLPLVEAALNTVRAAAQTKNIALHTALGVGLGLVMGDALRLQQVAWNLLSNAIKFTPEGGAVAIMLRRDGNEIELRVQDNGLGIQPEFLPHVFERLRQADSSTTREHGGLGIGLAIVRHIVEMHGGTIRAESEGENQGAAFTLRLPVVGASV